MTRGLLALHRLEGLGARQARSALQAARVELGRAEAWLEARVEAEAVARARALVTPPGAASVGRAVGLAQGAAHAAWLRAVARSASRQRQDAEVRRLQAAAVELHHQGGLREARRRGRVLELVLARRAAERARVRRRAEEAEADDAWRPEEPGQGAESAPTYRVTAGRSR